MICWLYTLLGALDPAYESVNRMLDEMARSGPVWVLPGGLWLPQMRPFRQDPRFQALVMLAKTWLDCGVLSHTAKLRNYW